jgi:hypothetical protein
MGYLGTKPANSPLTSELIPDGIISTSDLATGSVTQDKLSTYIAPKGTPAFSAYANAATQTLNGSTFTKVQINLEEFDTNNNFDSTTNFRFTPSVAGYYQINGAVNLNNSSASAFASLYKNGSEYKRGTSSTAFDMLVCCLVYFNGSTDYLELYAYQGGSATTINGGSTFQTWFNGALVRAA